ncbi:hypothetical protein [Microbacterium dextranolyticum]|uniref:Uncharacterized protein n=1 Tax=Microbacterium dextranolyticum TaxID=36806 RepID=A0A9W6M6C8_9MICO|nr:hypothetical protein [Microbacterium dextranolyticum]MBM7463163.1 hypothetical protein [Microbacterium dextranolyticum]GLJ95731.1 hypothetical protein GCM10017591_17940 [Microbacterium dextranolyticum]
MQITTANETRITAALAKAQPRARTNVATVKDVRTAVADAEQRLTALGIPKKLWRGVKFAWLTAGIPDHTIWEGGGHRIRYNATVPATELRLERTATGWRLDEIIRVELRSGMSVDAGDRLDLTDDALRYVTTRRAAIIERRIDTLRASLDAEVALLERYETALDTLPRSRARFEITNLPFA